MATHFTGLGNLSSRIGKIMIKLYVWTQVEHRKLYILPQVLLVISKVSMHVSRIWRCNKFYNLIFVATFVSTFLERIWRHTCLVMYRLFNIALFKYKDVLGNYTTH